MIFQDQTVTKYRHYDLNLSIAFQMPPIFQVLLQTVSSNNKKITVQASRKCSKLPTHAL